VRKGGVTRLAVCLVLVELVCLIGLVGAETPAYAFTPREGSGPNWCASYGGENLASYDNVYACQLLNVSAGKTPFDADTGFQCVELVNRFLYNSNGDTVFGEDVVGGNFVTLVGSRFSVPIGSSGPDSLPLPGDIVSMWGGSSGQSQGGSDSHVAVVTSVTSTSSGWSITTLNENDVSDTTTGNGLNTISVTNRGKTWSFNGGYFAIFDWLELVMAPPAAGTDAAGDQFVFWQGTDGGLWEKSFSYSTKQWSSPAPIEPANTLSSAPAVAVHADGEQDVFWMGTDGNLWEAWRANSRWNGPLNLGAGSLGSAPAAGTDAAGDQYVFWQGTDGGLWEKSFSYSTKQWSTPTPIEPANTLSSAPTVAVHAGGERDVFWRGTDSNLWEAWWANNRWNGPLNLGAEPVGSAPTAGTDAAGDQFVFWKGIQGGLWEKSYSYSARQWSLATLIEPANTLNSAPTVAVHADGERDVFWKGTDGNLWEAWWADNRWNGPLNLGAGPL
jgi:hypothetical protein